MSGHQKRPLKVITAGNRPRGKRAPVLVASNHTIDFTCGHCGLVLLRAEDQQVHGLLIHRTACGSHNATE